MRKFPRLILFIGVLLLLAGCDYIPSGYIPIDDIHQSPGRYEGKEIKVKGKVTNISKLPFLKTKNYTLRDETGEITVFTEDTLPPMDETIAIKATVKAMAIIDDQTVGLRLEEVKKLPTL
jgi:hypothetical protein